MNLDCPRTGIVPARRSIMSIQSLPIARLSLAQLQAAFLSIQQRIVTHARIIFRGQRCPARKDDLIAETVALAWA